MKTVNYYPQQSRLDFIGDDDLPVNGIIGVDAHVKAVNLAAQGQTVIFINIESKANQKANKSNKNA
jgi:hypothetical protein